MVLELSVILEPLELLSDGKTIHRNLDREAAGEVVHQELAIPDAGEHYASAAFSRTRSQICRQLKIQLLAYTLRPDTTLGDWHAIQRLLVWLNDLIGGDQAVLGRQNVPNALSTLDVLAGLGEPFRGVQILRRHRAIVLLADAGNQVDVGHTLIDSGRTCVRYG